MKTAKEIYEDCYLKHLDKSIEETTIILINEGIKEGLQYARQICASQGVFEHAKANIEKAIENLKSDNVGK